MFENQNNIRCNTLLVLTCLVSDICFQVFQHIHGFVGRMGSSLVRMSIYKECCGPSVEKARHCTTSQLLLSSCLRYDWKTFPGRIQDGFIDWIMVTAGCVWHPACAARSLM